MKKGANYSLRFRLRRKSRPEILERRRSVQFLKSLKGKTPLYPEVYARAEESLKHSFWLKELDTLFAPPRMRDSR